MSSSPLAVIAATFEALAGRSPDAVCADELLAAIHKAVPEVSMADLVLAADFLKRLSSRMRGAAWLLDPANLNSVYRHRHAGVHGHTRVREEGEDGRKQ